MNSEVKLFGLNDAGTLYSRELNPKSQNGWKPILKIDKAKRLTAVGDVLYLHKDKPFSTGHTGTLSVRLATESPACEEIDTGHADDVTAMASLGDRLYSCGPYFGQRSIDFKNHNWQLVDGGPGGFKAHCMTRLGRRLVAAHGPDKKHQLSEWSPGDAAWKPLGGASIEVVALAAVDDTLYAVGPDGKFWTRQGKGNWELHGETAVGIVALAAAPLAY